jgi:hypothetical protein
MGGAVLATPAMAQTAGGILTPIPQQIIGDRLVIENLVLRGITIRNCHIIAERGFPGIEVMNCHVQTVDDPAMVAGSSLVPTGYVDLRSSRGDYRVLTTDRS